MTHGSPALSPQPSSAARWSWIAHCTIGLWAGSLIFPLGASLLTTERIVHWVGIADVGLAIGMILLTLTLIVKAPPARASAAIIAQCYQAYRWMFNILLALLGFFLLTENAVHWDVLLIGLAWRAWLVGYALPSALTLATPSPAQSPS